MKTKCRSALQKLLPLAAAFASLTTAFGHITYNSRYFGTFSATDNKSVSITNQGFTGAHGWADATDADWGDSHKGRHFRITLLTAATVMIKVEAWDDGGTKAAGLKPAFTIYSGLVHLPPTQPDHDGAPISLAYLDSIPGTEEGALRTLTDWRIGNEDATTPYDFETMLSKFSYVGHYADGTSANFGNSPGIQGDGTADGVVEKAFDLPAGEYHLFVGGADYNTVDEVIYGAKVSVSVGPDPENGVTPVTPGEEGVPYKWKVLMEGTDQEELVAHVGAWSWEDNSLFDPGEPTLGWTHTSAWAGIELKAASHLTIGLARQEGVPWPAQDDPNRVASTASMFPSFTIWQHWDEDGDQEHTYDNRGNPVWAEDLVFVGLVDNSTEPTSLKSFNLPAGKYTIVFGSNAPATTPDRQGFKATLSTAPIAQSVALESGPATGLNGVTFKTLGSPAINDEEKVAFLATLAGTGVTTATDTAIFADIGTTQLKLVVREGDTDPNTEGLFAFLSDPANDNSGNVLFYARLKREVAGVKASNDGGLFRYLAASETLQLVAREGDVATGVEDGATYASFSSIVADSAGGAFVAKLVIRGRINAGNDTGVWLFHESGFTTLLAREGKPFTVAPGDTRIVKTLQILTPVPIVKGVGRSTNAFGGRVLSLTFKDGTSGIFHIAP